MLHDRDPPLHGELLVGTQREANLAAPVFMVLHRVAAVLKVVRQQLDNREILASTQGPVRQCNEGVRKGLQDAARGRQLQRRSAFEFKVEGGCSHRYEDPCHPSLAFTLISRPWYSSVLP